MQKSLTIPLACLATALALAACNKPADGDAAPADAKAEKAATADAGKDAPTIAGVPALPTQKQQVSYMMGMALAKQIKPMKDEVDLDTMVKALKTSLDDGKLLLTEEQAMQVGEAFTQKMQAKQLEERMEQARKNLADGKAFLEANGKKPGVVTTKSGLQYQVLEEGKGPKPSAEDVVKVEYKGALLDGTVFDDTAQHGGSADLPVAQVVPGWQEGLELMPVGSKYRFWIPAELGYGETGTPGGPIPPNATLVFDVSLLGIDKSAGK